jgi:hypothetical protein
MILWGGLVVHRGHYYYKAKTPSDLTLGMNACPAATGKVAVVFFAKCWIKLESKLRL